MIGRFFSWLGSVFASFFQWLGGLIARLCGVIVDCFYNFVQWIEDSIGSLCSDILEIGLDLVPNMSVERSVSDFAYMRRAWNTFDVFIPLSEGLTFAVTFLSFYLAVKLLAFIIRVILALIP